MTAGAIDRKTQKRLPRDADQILHLVLPPDGFHRFALLRLAAFTPGASYKDPRGDDRHGVAWPEHVAGQLQSHELVISEVVIERPDHPIAIGPGVRTQFVALEP